MDFDAHRKRLLLRLGNRYQGCSLDNFIEHGDTDDRSRQRRVLAAVRRYTEEMRRYVRDGTSLVLYGNAGTGKDHLLASLLWSATDSGIYARHISGPELLEQLKKEFRSSSKSGLQKQLQSVPVLSLSDPVTGDGVLSDWEKRVLFDLFDTRYRAGLPHWVSCNVVDDTDGQTRIGSQVWDRIVDRSVLLHCLWDSYRKPSIIV